jgi:4-amino-4-deoxy-L-arabinose transferase-like glycosyltransferase
MTIKPPTHRWRTSSIALILSAWAILQLGGLFTPGLLDDVDSIYIQVAREMLQRHDFVTPTIDGIRFFDKPPLMYWMAAGSMHLFGVHDWAARLPLALGVLALLLAVYALGIRFYPTPASLPATQNQFPPSAQDSGAPHLASEMWGTTNVREIPNDRAGLYAALALATCIGPYLYTRFYIPDILIALWMTLAVHLFLIARDRIHASHPAKSSIPSEVRDRNINAVILSETPSANLNTVILSAARSAQPKDPEALLGASTAQPFSTRKSALLPCLGFAAVAALSLLTKGLIGIVFPLGFVLLYLAFTRQLKLLPKFRLIPSTFVFLAIAAPWHILAALRNPPIPMPPGLGLPARAGWAWFYLYNEHIARFLGRRIPHDYGQVPIPLFWLLLALWLFPWVAFLPSALLNAYRTLRSPRTHPSPVIPSEAKRGRDPLASLSHPPSPVIPSEAKRGRDPLASLSHPPNSVIPSEAKRGRDPLASLSHPPSPVIPSEAKRGGDPLASLSHPPSPVIPSEAKRGGDPLASLSHPPNSVILSEARSAQSKDPETPHPATIARNLSAPTTPHLPTDTTPGVPCLASQTWVSTTLDRHREAALSCILWASIILGFFTLSSRQEYYHLPALPALALLVGGLLAAADAQQTNPINTAQQALRGALYFLLPLGTLLFLLCGYLALTAPTPHPGTTLNDALSSNPALYNLSLGHVFDLTGQAMGFFRGPLLAVAICMLTLGPIAYLVRRRNPFAANLLIATSMLGVLLAAHTGLVRFYPILGSKDLALAIDAQLRPNDLILIDGELTAGSTLLFYTPQSNAPVLLVNGRVNGPWFGSFYPDAPKIFPTDADLHALWHGPRRLFLLTNHPEQRTADLTSFAPVHTFATSGGKTILTNR